MKKVVHLLHIALFGLFLTGTASAADAKPNLLLIIAGVGVKNGGALEPAVLHVTDLVPTFLDLAGATHPSGTDPKLAPPRGKSLTPLLSGETEALPALWEDDVARNAVILTDEGPFKAKRLP